MDGWIVVAGYSVFDFEWVVEDVSESPKEALFISNHLQNFLDI